MSYINDKVPCPSCGDLFDPDLLEERGICRDCIMEESFLQDSIQDWKNDQ